MEGSINIAIVLTLLVLGFIFGKIAEARHFSAIKAREAALIDLPTTNSKLPLGAVPEDCRGELVQGSVVISVDYFKRMLASLRNFFGGSVQSYETLLDRARREAILRMKEEAQGASQIFNLRIETSSISKGAQSGIGSVEVLVYGTALFSDAKQ